MRFGFVHNFPGGVYPSHQKSATRNKPIQKLPPPEEVVISLTPRGEAACRPQAEPGQMVARGQLIGLPEGDGTPVYASVSGRVEAVEPRPALSGGAPLSVVIRRTEGEEVRLPFAGKAGRMTPEQLLDAVRQLGLGEMDGHRPALHRRLREGRGRTRLLILNGCESEPLLTAVHRVMTERADQVVCGARLLLELLEAEACVIAVESNKLDAIEALRSRLPLRGGPIRVLPLKARYPQELERPLVYTCTGIELARDQSPLAAGCVVVGAAAAAAVYQGLEEGLPFLSRVVTVAGSQVERPLNLEVPLGTAMDELLKACGGCKNAPRCFVAGGPMRGTELQDLSLPLSGEYPALLALGEKEPWAAAAEPVCLRCSQCVQVCPVRLMPLYFHLYRDNPGQLARYHIQDCMECGACTYVCPAHIPITHQIRQGKALVGEEGRP